MSDEEIRETIVKTGFNLYGNFRKEEKRKIINAFSDKCNDDYTIALSTNEWGNRELKITIFNPNVPMEFWSTGHGYDEDNDVIRYFRFSY